MEDKSPKAEGLPTMQRETGQKMTELKTLKDIEEEVAEWKGINNFETIVRKKYALSIELRQEAIKWIKFIDNAYMADTKGKPESKRTRECMIAWIKHFFNITDEDLK